MLRPDLAAGSGLHFTRRGEALDLELSTARHPDRVGSCRGLLRCRFGTSLLRPTKARGTRSKPTKNPVQRDATGVGFSSPAVAKCRGRRYADRHDRAVRDHAGHG
jgi:hypothetical protein